jgi:hypothetical protein
MGKPKMSQIKIVIVLSMVACLLAFQNCSSSHNHDGGSVADSSQNPQSILQNAQVQSLQVFNGVNGQSEIEAAIQALQSILQQIENLDPAKLSPDLQQLRTQLIQQISADITLLQQALQNLGNNPPIPVPVGPCGNDARTIECFCGGPMPDRCADITGQAPQAGGGVFQCVAGVWTLTGGNPSWDACL